jgi:hypothetical protein
MQNLDFIVALSSAHYHNGAHCWQHLDVECRCLSINFQSEPHPVIDDGHHIDVTIGDLCPGCGTDGIDLSEGAFAALAPLDTGRISIEWHFK